MSAIRKSILPAALMLAFVVGSAAPAAAGGPGVWSYLRVGQGGLSVSLVNMTSWRLVIVGNDFDIECNSLAWGRCSSWKQSYPFQGAGVLGQFGTLYLDPYRTAIWTSRAVGGKDSSEDGYYAWSGHFLVQPEPTDLPVPDSYPVGSAFAVSVNMHWQDPHSTFLHNNPGKGTWISLQTNFNSGVWSQDFNAFSPEGIWVAPDFLNNYTSMENVMTLSSKDFIVSLYCSSKDNKHVTLVFRQNFWEPVPYTLEYDDYKGWPLRYVDNAGNSVP